ncbi:hypothetical protein KCU88_g278, partial [Aureobasidium melanogenum]
MGVFYETLPPSLVPWLLDQKVYWIASAPLSGDGHVNLSPKGTYDKGGPYFGVIKEPLPNGTKADRTNDQASATDKAASESPSDEDKNVVIRKFWYMDLTGSGIETTSHLHEPGNGRITVMFMAFTGPPRILRIFGKGTVLEYGTAEFNEMISSQNITTIPGTRSIIMVDIHQVGTSCGFSVPYYDFVSFRTTLHDFFEKRVANEKAGKRTQGIEQLPLSLNSLNGFNSSLSGSALSAETGGVGPVGTLLPAKPVQIRGGKSFKDLGARSICYILRQGVHSRYPQRRGQLTVYSPAEAG